MTTTPSEPRPEAIIADLHRIRADLLAAAGDDLRAYVEAARKRQQASGRRVITRPARSLAGK